MITDAHKGIGAEIALDAARKNFDIYINYASHHEQAEHTASQVLNHGVRANSVLPDIVKTPNLANSGKQNRFAERSALMPMGRDGNPDEIANAVMWSTDEKNPFTNGPCIPVSGVV